MGSLIFDNNKKYFKLVLGLGNCSYSEIEQLCRVYALAGADIFDLSPNVKSVQAAKNGVKLAGLDPNDFKYCVSFGVKGDSHIKKAKINTEKCKRCYKCVSRCPQEAIVMGEKGYPKVLDAKCIGCQRCKKDCIDFYDNETDIKQTAKELSTQNIDMVELHISSFAKKEVKKNWNKILKYFNCQKSICIDRSKYGNTKLRDFILELTNKNPQKTIIQADGVPMSGENSLACTLQALAHAQLYKDTNMPIFISGGTNASTAEYATKFELRYDGITIGSYARNLVKNDINSGDWDIAIEKAKRLVATVKGGHD